MFPERHSKTSLSAVLLDLDDTLYPESDFVRGGFHAAAELLAMRSSRDTDELFGLLMDHFQRGVRGSVFNAVLFEMQIPRDPELIEDLIRAYRSHEPQLTLFPDAEWLLPILSPRYALGILTDGPAEVQRRKVKALGLQNRVEAIVYSDDFGREQWKPSPIPYLELLRRLHIEPSHAVYVGDNPKKDFVGARRLGLQTVRVRRPNTEHVHIEPPPGFEADHEITTLHDLPNWLTANIRSERHAA
jgi:putative hydrolase of the HAD superfamily